MGSELIEKPANINLKLKSEKLFSVEYYIIILYIMYIYYYSKVLLYSGIIILCHIILVILK